MCGESSSARNRVSNVVFLPGVCRSLFKECQLCSRRWKKEARHSGCMICNGLWMPAPVGVDTQFGSSCWSLSDVVVATACPVADFGQLLAPAISSIQLDVLFSTDHDFISLLSPAPSISLHTLAMVKDSYYLIVVAALVEDAPLNNILLGHSQLLQSPSARSQRRMHGDIA